MKHTYKISGMTCNGCRSHVEKALAEVPGVTHVEVDLENAKAEIEMEKHIPLEQFQEKLAAEGDRYHIQLHEQQQNGNHSTPMKHTYSISGMTCNGCRSHVEKALSEIPGVTDVEVDLEKAQAEIEMEKHISLKTFQEKLEQDGGNYSIGMPGEKPKPKAKPQATGSGVYYCPMHCEGDKTYDKPGDCPVC